MNRRVYFLIYTGLYAFLILGVFGVFFVNGKSFIWASDGWKQAFQALQYYAKWMREIARTLLFEHRLEIPTFSFSIGYGSDILTTLHYYVIGDPFSFLSIFVPIRYMKYFYGALILLRLYLSGVAFSGYCFYRNGKRQNLEAGVCFPDGALPSKHVLKKKKYLAEDEGLFTMTGILAGSFVYVFCGFALFASVRHPYFINPMIWFPMILTGVEKIMDRKSPVFLSFSVFLAAVSNFYFFYMIAILTVLYVIWRLVPRYSMWVKFFVKITASAFLGACMGAFILLPVIACFLGDSRSENYTSVSLFYTVGEYESNFGNFLSANSGHQWLIFGYAGVALVAILLLFFQKTHRDVKVAFLVLTAMTLLPAAGKLMNGFSYVTNRWVWGYSFLVGFIVALKWRALFQVSADEKCKLTLCLFVYCLICLVLVKSRTSAAFFGLSMAVLSMTFASAMRERFGIQWAQVLLVLCVFVNIVGNAVFKYAPENGNYVSEFVDMDMVETRMASTEVNAIAEVSAGDEEFFRYTGAGLQKNASLCGETHTTQFYWSLSNGSIARARTEAAFSEEISGYSYKSLESRTFLTTLANVKYVVNDSTPYGFTNLGKIDGYQICVNDYFLPFGYTYARAISREEYENMTPLQKQEAMMQACVIEEVETDADVNGTDTGESELLEGQNAESQEKRESLVFTGISVPYEIEAADGVVLGDRTISVSSQNATLTLYIDGQENSEVYVYLTGLSYSGASPMAQYSDETWETLSTYTKRRVRYRNKYWKEDTRLEIKMTALDSEGDTSSGTLTYFTPDYQWYGNREDFMVNLGYDEHGRTTITLTFENTGTYSFDSLEVFCQPMDNYVEQVSALAEDVMENVDFHETEMNATKEVAGTIHLEQAKYLLLTIPWSSGWTAYVDGEKQELLQANTMYMSLFLEPGDHEIQLVYHTPGLAAGMVVSAIALIIFLLMANKKYE